MKCTNYFVVKLEKKWNLFTVFCLGNNSGFNFPIDFMHLTVLKYMYVTKKISTFHRIIKHNLIVILGISIDILHTVALGQIKILQTPRNK